VEISKDSTVSVNVDEFSSTGTFRDAFGRLRVSSPQVLGFGAYEYGLNSTFIESSSVLTGVVSNLTNESSISLSNGGDISGSVAVASTRMFHRYVPGRSQLVRFTGSFGTPTTNVIQRAGYFSSKDGLFLEYTGTTLNFVRRTHTSGSVVDFKIPRSSWSDPLDGTGPSGINCMLRFCWN
jgi:hypothetical protein